MDAVTGIITTVAGNGTQTYNGGVRGGDGKLATDAAFWNPCGIVLDGAGNIYVAEPGASSIRRIDATTRIVSTVTGTGGRYYFGDGGDAVSAVLNIPNDLVLTSGGQIVIADSQNHVLRIVNCSSAAPPPPAGSGPPPPAFRAAPPPPRGSSPCMYFGAPHCSSD